VRRSAPHASLAEKGEQQCVASFKTVVIDDRRQTVVFVDFLAFSK
jgi:hypothetical protein